MLTVREFRWFSCKPLISLFAAIYMTAGDHVLTNKSSIIHGHSKGAAILFSESRLVENI